MEARVSVGDRIQTYRTEVKIAEETGPPGVYARLTGRLASLKTARKTPEPLAVSTLKSRANSLERRAILSGRAESMVLIVSTTMGRFCDDVAEYYLGRAEGYREVVTLVERAVETDDSVVDSED